MIYTITALVEPTTDHPCGARCFGFHFDIDVACASVAANEANMHEALYQWIVIEEYQPGIHPIAREMSWYRWDGEQWSVLAAKPTWAEGVVNWALG